MVYRVLPDLTFVAATRSHRLRGRDPLALPLVARSPSRSYCYDRWWALTPPFHPLPAHDSEESNCRRDCSLLRL